MKSNSLHLILLVLTISHANSQHKSTLYQWRRQITEINGRNYTSYTANIEVAENRRSTSTRKIILPVSIIKAAAAKPLEPVFWFGGGPGQSNLSVVRYEKLLGYHDLVCVGYRGVDGSTKLISKKLSKAWRGLNGNVLGDESLNNIEKAALEFQTDLKKAEVDIDGYTIMDVVDDVEEIRVALGYEQINLLSFSYGTRIALLYSYKYPLTVKRSLMVAANPPGNFVWDPTNTEKILDRYDSLYRSQNNSDRGSIKDAITKAFEQMPKRWSIFKLSADKIKCATFLSLYQKQNAIIGFDAYFKAAYDHDYSGVYMAQVMFDMMITQGVAGDFYQKAISADLDPDKNYRTYLRQDHTTLGPNLSLLSWGSAGSWTTNAIPDEYRHVRTSQTETLILSGDLDVATPWQLAKDQLMPHLPNGRQIIVKNMSHVDLLYNQYDNVNQLAGEFFDGGVINDKLFHEASVSFVPARKLSAMSKKLYPLLILLALFK